MQLEWHYILGIITLAIGGIFILFGLLHELTWLRRRGWFMTKGTVIGHKGDGKDGSVRYPIIEYHTAQGSKSFVSKYGGAKPPEVGDEVRVAFHPSMKTQEHFTVANRILFTVLALGLGSLIVILGMVIIKRSQASENQIDEVKKEAAVCMVVGDDSGHCTVYSG